MPSYVTNHSFLVPTSGLPQTSERQTKAWSENLQRVGRAAGITTTESAGGGLDRRRSGVSTPNSSGGRRNRTSVWCDIGGREITEDGEFRNRIASRPAHPRRFLVMHVSGGKDVVLGSSGSTAAVHRNSLWCLRQVLSPRAISPISHLYYPVTLLLLQRGSLRSVGLEPS
jgi:hypothetical protein